MTEEEKLGLDQAQLAEKAGTSRKWLIEVEQGKPGAEIGLVLRTLRILGVSLTIEGDVARWSTSASDPVPSIDSILDSLKKK